MTNMVFFAVLILSLFTAGSSLSCRWLDQKFTQYSEKSLELLGTMVNNNSSNTAEDAEHEVAFPQDLYTQASKASAVERLGFMVQILEQVAVLFEETHNSTSWEENTVENFLSVITQQADGLSSCIWSHKMKKNKKLHMYFKRLSGHILHRMGHSAEGWELIRKETKIHLFKVNQLVSSPPSTN
ncbi:hypothetical protein PAMA_012270 [Pampus argenteus]